MRATICVGVGHPDAKRGDHLLLALAPVLDVVAQHARGSSITGPCAGSIRRARERARARATPDRRRGRRQARRNDDGRPLTRQIAAEQRRRLLRARSRDGRARGRACAPRSAVSPAAIAVAVGQRFPTDAATRRPARATASSEADVGHALGDRGSAGCVIDMRVGDEHLRERRAPERVARAHRDAAARRCPHRSASARGRESATSSSRHRSSARG